MTNPVKQKAFTAKDAKDAKDAKGKRKDIQNMKLRKNVDAAWS